MNDEILRRTPSKIFCPLCGKWHEWKGGRLKLHDENNKYQYSCECGGNQVEIKIWHEKGFLYIESTLLCKKANDNIFGKVPLKDINCVKQTSFKVEIITDNPINSSECNSCGYYERCNLRLIGDKHNREDNIVLALEFRIKFIKE